MRAKQKARKENSMSAKDGRAKGQTVSATEQLIAMLGPKRYHADWTNTRQRVRRLVSEFIGTFGLLFVLSAGAGAITAGAGAPVNKVALIALLSATSALWLVATIYALGDVSAHFNPAMTFACALRGDMHWYMAAAYWGVQCVAAAAGSLLARAFFGTTSHLAATTPPPGQAWLAAGFEAIITGGLVLGILSVSARPKLNDPFAATVPLSRCSASSSASWSLPHTHFRCSPACPRSIPVCWKATGWRPPWCGR
jgi:glycerol uptake facilitator-like aquaporin